MPERPIRFLFAMFQGGGNIPLIMPIVSELVRRGHDVRIMAGPGIRGRPQPVTEDFLGRIARSGATRVPFQAPDVDPHEDAPPVRGVAFGWMPKRYEPISSRGARTALWSAHWASNVMDELQRDPVDVLVCDFFLYGAIAAGEASRVSTAVIVHNAFPAKPGRLPPARSYFERLRQIPQRWMLQRIWARDGLPLHNDVRRGLGLLPIKQSPVAECDRAARVLVLSYEWFDFPANDRHPNVCYVGTPLDDADIAPDAWTSPWDGDDERPLVLVSMSTLPQGQGPALHRIVEAVDGMPVRALVTLGPSMTREDFRAGPNVVFEQFVPHSAVLPHAAAIISQCGLGTLTKALRHGVPMVCMPVLGDQPDNAARIVGKGAGVRLSPEAPTEEIRAALTRVLAEPTFREAARRVGELMAGDRAEERAADELETVAQREPV